MNARSSSRDDMVWSVAWLAIALAVAIIVFFVI